MSSVSKSLKTISLFEIEKSSEFEDLIKQLFQHLKWSKPAK
jgi:hypothetical protein